MAQRQAVENVALKVPFSDRDRYGKGEGEGEGMLSNGLDDDEIAFVLP